MTDQFITNQPVKLNRMDKQPSKIGSGGKPKEKNHAGWLIIFVYVY